MDDPWPARNAPQAHHQLAPNKKPDIDNILKSVMDSLNGYAFADDSQVVRIMAEKVYAEEPFVEVTIDELL